MNIEQIYRDLPLLQTPRLILRKVELADARDMFEYANDPEVARYVGWAAHRTIQETKEFIQFIIGLYKSAQIAPWGIEFKESGRFIGTIGFHYWLTEHRRAELGYAIGREFWGQGFATEAVQRLLDFGFNEMNLHRIEARCEPPNVASQRVLEKCGMTYEGLLRDHMYAKGAFCNLKLYSILKPEWQDR